MNRATPVIIGVGQVVQRNEIEPPHDPLALMHDAVVLAAQDAGGGEVLLRDLDRIDVVNVASWAYGDVAAELAARVGATSATSQHSEWGGQQPTSLVDRAAKLIAAGEHRLIAICGAEAFHSLDRALRAGTMPSWPPPPPHAPPPPDPRSMVPATAWEHGLRMPPEVYPLYENAVRARIGLSFAESQAWSGRMWARMSEVATTNDGAWNPTPMTAEDITTVKPENRMVCFPYPKFLNALLAVDQGAAVLMADAETARRVGVPPSRWVYPWGGAGAHDPENILARVDYTRSPAMEAVLDDVFPVSGLDRFNVDLVELYSCFPCVPKMALTHLGWDRDHPISVTGGLTFFGGAGNNYMTHAVVAMVRALRAGRGETALLYGQGGFVTKHHALVITREPRPGSYPEDDANGAAMRQARVDALGAPPLTTAPHGPAEIETYTLVYDRGGRPEQGIIIGRLETGERFVANTPADDDEELELLVAGEHEPIGMRGAVAPGPDGQNVFGVV